MQSCLARPCFPSELKCILGRIEKLTEEDKYCAPRDYTEHFLTEETVRVKDEDEIPAQHIFPLNVSDEPGEVEIDHGGPPLNRDISRISVDAGPSKMPIIVTGATIGLSTPGDDYRTWRKMYSYRDFNSVDPEEFRRALQEVCLRVPDGCTAEEALRIYDSALEEVVRKLVPMKRRKEVKSVKLWRERQDVREALRERRRAERAWESNKTGLNKMQYKELQKRFEKIDKQARMEFTRKQLEEVKDDPAALQKRLGRLLGKAETVLPGGVSDGKLAGEWAEFFSGKIEKIRTAVRAEQEEGSEERHVDSMPVPTYPYFHQ
eukprot:sb/3466882/